MRGPTFGIRKKPIPDPGVPDPEHSLIQSFNHHYYRPHYPVLEKNKHGYRFFNLRIL
jgi:hypothetical protein